MEAESDWNAAAWGGQSGEHTAWVTGSPGVFPGHLIVDSAAGQAFIGEAACIRRERKLNDAGLRDVQVHTNDNPLPSSQREWEVQHVKFVLRWSSSDLMRASVEGRSRNLVSMPLFWKDHHSS